MLYILDNEAYRGGWMFSLTTPPTYDENKSFWKNLGDNVKNVLTGTRRLILMSGAANLQIVPNCLIDYGPYLPPYSYNPIVPYNNGLGNLNPMSLNPEDEETLKRNTRYTMDGTIDKASDNLSNIPAGGYLTLNPEDVERIK